MKQWEEQRERKVRSASSLDELLRLANFPDWKLWKCRLRLQQPETLSSPPSVGSHRSTRYAAESYSLEILKGGINDMLGAGLCMCVDAVTSIACLPFSHRWRVAADSVHAKGNVCRRGQGARHQPLNFLQATVCVRPQVRLTWNQNFNMGHQTQTTSILQISLISVHKYLKSSFNFFIIALKEMFHILRHACIRFLAKSWTWRLIAFSSLYYKYEATSS